MHTNTIIIGAGQAGLAMSRCLGEQGIEHLILERGRIAERWRSQRWDSLRLLTPRWQSRLPGWSYRGADPDGYMGREELIAYLEGYARSSSAPVVEGCEVLEVASDAGGYRVVTDRGTWRSDNVVIATGACDVPALPAWSTRLGRHLVQHTTTTYKRPDALPEGGVLVVGASASGVQLADELQRSGRPVTLAVGRHTRVPRVYRGRDIMSWLSACGILGEPAAAIRDLERARRQPSFQLVGRDDRRDVDLLGLHRLGVTLVGRARSAEGDRVELAGDLAASDGDSQRRLDRLLDRIDRHIERAGIEHRVAPATRPERLPVVEPPRSIDLRGAGIASVVWATGFRRTYPWLRVPVVDERGEIRHAGGVTPAPGLYVLGLPVLRHRGSTYIDGVGRDAVALAGHITGRCRRRGVSVAA